MTTILKNKLMALIPESREDRVTLSYLCQMMDMKPRDVKKLIFELRETYPICATETDGGGYWISYDPIEITEFVNMIYKRSKGYIKTMQNMNRHKGVGQYQHNI